MRTNIVLSFALVLVTGCSATDAVKPPVDDPGDVASVDISLGRPLDGSLSVLDTITLTAVARDRAGNALDAAPISWGLTLERALSPGERLGSIEQTGPHTALLTMESEYAIVVAGTKRASTQLLVTGKFPVSAPRRWQGFIWSPESGFTRIPAPSGADVIPSGINDRGEIVGTVRLPVAGERAFFWSESAGFTYLNPPGFQGHSNALAINASGLVTGWNNSGFSDQAFVWSRDGGMKFLLSGPEGRMSFSEGVAINAAGQVAVHSEDFDTDFSGLRWSPPSAPERLEVHADNPNSQVVAINDAGDILGYDGVWSGWDPALDRPAPILWTAKGERIDIADCNRQCTMQVSSLNNRGEIAGTLNRSAFRRSAAGEISTVPLAPATWARGMNDRGDVIGQTVQNDSNGAGSWLWTANGKVISLGLPTGAQVAYVVAINNNGLVVGHFR